MSTNIENFALIIGAMKSGTSTLFDYLSQHPEICSCQKKEPDFFRSYRNWSKGFDWYQSLWKWNPNLHKVALEASVRYTIRDEWPKTVERIYQTKAKFKFIYILRNPVERIESHFNFLQNIPGQRYRSFSEVMPNLIAVSKYGMQLDKYYKKFPAEDILILYFDDLKSQPKEMLKKVCKFLNVDASYEFHGLGKVSNPTLFSNTLLYAIKSNKKLSDVILSVFPRKLVKLITRPMKSKTKANFKLSPEQGEYVLSELKEDMKKLKEKYGVNIERWNLGV